MSQQVIVSKGIYHGLPTFPDDLNGLTAIVAGANGISGDHMVSIEIETIVVLRFAKYICSFVCFANRPNAGRRSTPYPVDLPMDNGQAMLSIYPWTS